MEGTSSSQEINQEEEVVRSIKTMFDNVPPLLSEYSIYRVPERLRKVNEEAYTPMVVSIGPYHHGKEKYKTMEYQKLRYLYSYLLRDNSVPLHHCVKLVLGLERSAREFYAETISYTKKEFVKMMLVDGFFIVELIRQYYYPDLRNEFDPIFKNHWIFNAVHRDMLLLENQLPFSVLESLYTLINDSADERFRTDRSFLELTDFLLCYYKPIPNHDESSLLYHRDGYHLLHLSLQRVIYPIQEQRVTFPSRNNKDDLAFIPSATELHEAGIKFQGLGEDWKHLLAVRFIKDVALLRDHGIIRNWLGDNEEVAQLFNKLRSGIIACSTEFYFYELFADVNEFYNTRWHAWKAKLKRDYFNTPWASLSFVAAVFLLVCTLVQTVCSIIQVVQN